MNNKSPLELRPCSGVAGDTVRSNLGMQLVVYREKTNYEDLTPAGEEAAK